MIARFLMTAALGLFSLSGCESSRAPDAAPAPLDFDALAEFLLERLALQPGERFVTGSFENLAVTHNIGYTKVRHARLARAEEFSRPAQRQICLGDFEPIIRLRHYPKTPDGLISWGILCQ